MKPFLFWKAKAAAETEHANDYLCDKGAELDDYLAKRISDCWAVRDAKPPIKAHYARLKGETEAEFQNHIKSCDQCSAHMARIA